MEILVSRCPVSGPTGAAAVNPSVVSVDQFRLEMNAFQTVYPITRFSSSTATFIRAAAFLRARFQMVLEVPFVRIHRLTFRGAIIRDRISVYIALRILQASEAWNHRRRRSHRPSATTRCAGNGRRQPLSLAPLHLFFPDSLEQMPRM